MALSSVVGIPLYALFHCWRTDGDTLLQVRGGARGSQVNQKGVDGWMALQGSLLMHPARPSLLMPTSPAAFEKLNKAEWRLGSRPPGAPSSALRPHYSTLP